MRTASLGLTVALTLSACVRTGYDPIPSFDRSVISQDEISDARANTGLDLVQKLRPTFLSPPGYTSIMGMAAAPTVYVNGLRFGSVATLQEIPANQIAEIRMYRVGAAATFGARQGTSVLDVQLRSR
jgi:hypothetical protein